MSYLDEDEDEDISYRDYHFKSHSLLHSATNLTSTQMNLFALMLTEMNVSDWYSDGGEEITPTYTFRKEVLTEWFGIASHQLTAYLKAPSKRLAQKQIGIETSNGYRYRPILSDIAFEKGTLTIAPNGALRDVYLINTSKKGHAKIYNDVYRALNNPNTKKVYDFLSRHKNETEMYHLSIHKLQIYFGIFRENGELLKKSYKNPRRFIERIIKPALKQISDCELAKKRLTLIDGEHSFGYDLKSMTSGDMKIKFLVRWKSELTEKEKEQKYDMVIKCVERLEITKKETGNTSKETQVILELVEKLLRELELHTQAANFSKEIKILKRQRAIEKTNQEKNISKKRNIVDDALNIYFNNPDSHK